MRLRLFLSFILIVLFSTSSVVVLARRNTTAEVQRFGLEGAEGLRADLEAYYRRTGGWGSVGALLFRPGPGRGPGSQTGPGHPAEQRFRLADVDGQILADTSFPGRGGVLDPEELERALPLEVGSEIVGYLLPERRIGFSPADQRVLIARMSQSALTAALISGVVSLGIAFGLAYTVLRPVRELTRAATSLAGGDLSQRVPVRGQDELAVLGARFNEMAENLQRAQVSRREMTADIAHELRNPLSVQRAHLEALQDGLYPLESDSLDPILEQNLLLTRLVEDLRTLALADTGQLELERQDVHLESLVRGVARRFEAQADALQVDLNVSLGERCPPVSADPQRVEQILGNLLTNALQFSPPGSAVTLRLTCSPSGATVTVRDSGPGIPAESLGRIFERFYRADRGRTRAEGGSGLGLSIARKLAEAHGGTLQAANHPEGGARFSLTLPLGGPDDHPK